MKNQKIRSMKVHEQSGYNYKATPTIILKGQWLKEMGFEIGDYISVSCEEADYYSGCRKGYNGKGRNGIHGEGNEEAPEAFSGRERTAPCSVCG